MITISGVRVSPAPRMMALPTSIKPMRANDGPAMRNQAVPCTTTPGSPPNRAMMG